MNLILTVDDKGGLAFNKRRQSRDKSVISDAIKLAERENCKLVCSQYSIELFDGFDFEPEILSLDEVPMKAYSDLIYFLESQSLESFVNFDKVIVYKWNRVYPADVKVNLDQLLADFDLEETVEFEGNSHECITREIWGRKGAK